MIYMLRDHSNMFFRILMWVGHVYEPFLGIIYNNGQQLLYLGPYTIYKLNYLSFWNVWPCDGQMESQNIAKLYFNPKKHTINMKSVSELFGRFVVSTVKTNIYIRR
jgi:hypothetical protein